MKKMLKSFISFNRTERMGLVGLCALLIILITVRATMHYWVHPTIDTEKEKKLVAAWETFKRTQTKSAGDSTSQQKNDYQDAFDENETPLPNVIDLNTADSATLVRLKGIGPVTAGKIVSRRNNKGPFTDVDQLKEVGVFNAATFEILKKHLTVAPPKQN